MKDKKVYYILAGALILFALLRWGINEVRPKPPDIEDSFSRTDKVIYGSYILYELLGDLFPQRDIHEIKQTASQQTYTIYEDDYPSTSYVNYIFINNNLRELNAIDVDELLYFASIGNQVFMSTRIFPDALVDSLNFEVSTSFTPLDFSLIDFEEEDEITDTINLEEVTKTNLLDYFSEYDTSRTFVLARNEDQQANLIKVNWGSGEIILSTTPNLFTNYHILKSKDRAYIEHALSSLSPQNDIWWDEYYKVRFHMQREMEKSPLQYIFSQESLTWAYWLIVLCIVLYVLFEAKRRQRIIPIIPPLPNATLEFTETIGRLYYESKDHQNIAEKKIKVLLAYIRRKYYLRTHLFTDEFMKSLAAKSGITKEEIIDLCKTIDRIRRRTDITEIELIELNKKIESFYTESKR